MAGKPVMIKKVVNKYKLDQIDDRRDIEYWLSRPSSERFEAVDLLRKQMYGNSKRLQRVLRVTKLQSS